MTLLSGYRGSLFSERGRWHGYRRSVRMRATKFLFRGTGLRIEAFELDDDGVSLVVTARTARAPCPSCGRSSRRVHSRYRRSVADVAWGGVAVTCRLLVRRFRCGRAACPQRIFCERVSQFAAAHARRTERLRALLRDVGFALGGRPGERFLPALHTGIAARADDT